MLAPDETAGTFLHDMALITIFFSSSNEVYVGTSWKCLEHDGNAFNLWKLMESYEYSVLLT